MEKAQQRFEKLVLALSSDLYRYAFFLCRNKELAEDLVQETFIRAWRFLESLKDESKAKSWLFTTLRREFARQFERYQPRFDDVEPDLLPGERGAPVDVLVVRRAMLELPLKYRDPIVLQVIGGYSGEEIANMLAVPRATVNTRLFRARQRLRKIFERGVSDIDLDENEVSA
ncbi:MAG TPA: sigma-70 family RNA polymerase sigma factor [Gammaproteobacteria bacterium]|nr:sigma-70 family RNA polymerase sigma factor [Gammaproteobacteria bacterium]